MEEFSVKLSTSNSKVVVNTFLVLFIPVIIVIFKVVPRITEWILGKYQLFSEEEANKIAEAVKIKDQMKGISMVDEFAAYAKLQRKLNQINLDLEATVQARKNLQAKVKTYMTVGLYVLSSLIYFSLLFFIGIRTPVFIVPKQWFFPFNVLLSYPTGVEGAISIPIWTVTMRNVISLLIH